MKQLTHGSLSAGIEGFGAGAKQNGQSARELLRGYSVESKKRKSKKVKE
jgi:hypothetical protein